MSALAQAVILASQGRDPDKIADILSGKSIRPGVAVALPRSLALLPLLFLSEAARAG